MGSERKILKKELLASSITRCAREISYSHLEPAGGGLAQDALDAMGQVKHHV